MLAAASKTSSSLKPGAGTTRSKAGFPSVKVPVLSTISIVTCRNPSIAAASRNRMPCVAARPVAAIIDIGVASPNAQGQAMIRTATAFTKPYTQLGCGPNKPQAGGGGGAAPAAGAAGGPAAAAAGRGV